MRNVWGTKNRRSGRHTAAPTGGTEKAMEIYVTAPKREHPQRGLTKENSTAACRRATG